MRFLCLMVLINCPELLFCQTAEDGSTPEFAIYLGHVNITKPLTKKYLLSQKYITPIVINDSKFKGQYKIIDYIVHAVTSGVYHPMRVKGNDFTPLHSYIQSACKNDFFVLDSIHINGAADFYLGSYALDIKIDPDSFQWNCFAEVVHNMLKKDSAIIRFPHDNGNTKFEYTYIKSKRTEFKEYHSNGSLHVQAKYIGDDSMLMNYYDSSRKLLSSGYFISIQKFEGLKLVFDTSAYESQPFVLAIDSLIPRNPDFEKYIPWGKWRFTSPATGDLSIQIGYKIIPDFLHVSGSRACAIGVYKFPDAYPPVFHFDLTDDYKSYNHQSGPERDLIGSFDIWQSRYYLFCTQQK